MLLTLYDDLNEFTADLVKNSVLEEKNFNIFVKEIIKENINVCFFDNDNGDFTCYIWTKDINMTREDEIVFAIIDAWAFYCKITDEQTIEYIKTGCALTNVILKNII